MAPSPATPLQWFGSSGIRGPPDRVSVDVALALGGAVGSRFARLVVGRDARLTGPALEHAFIAGATSRGAHVTRAGIVPTPGIAFAARDVDLGVVVTASHNPAPDNGFKFWLPDGAALTGPILHELEASMSSPAPAQGWRGVGQVTEDDGVARGYADAIVQHLQERAASWPGTPPVDASRPLAGTRIALDTAHGSGALVTPSLLTRLGAKVRSVGGSPDGRFPDRPSEPTAAHLAGFSAMMRADDEGFQLGIAHDGDADRTVFLHPDGDLIDPVGLLTVLAGRRQDTSVALPVDASGIFADTHPGIPVTTTPVGDVHLSAAVHEGRATAACEPSGTWFFSEWSPTPEGPFAAAAVAAWIASDPTILDEVARLPTYARASTKVAWPDGAPRHAAIERSTNVATILAESMDVTETITVDGVKTLTADGWVLVRASGTEPIFRVTAEAKHRERADELVAAGTAALERVLMEARA